MDRRRTIYKLRDLRISMILSLLNLLGGLVFWSVLKTIPLSIQSGIHNKMLIKLTDNADIFASAHTITKDIMALFHKTSLEIIIISLIPIASILLLIRLNGNLKTRKFISGTLTAGTSIVNLAAVAFLLRYINLASTELASYGIRIIFGIGVLLLITGFIILVFKVLNDLTSPISTI
jgi:hypothetical protein